MTRNPGTRFDDPLRTTSDTRDTLVGGAGDDTFVFFGHGLSDRFLGGGGNGTFVIDPFTSGVSGTIITDFRSRRDSIEFDNDTADPGDLVFVNRPEEVGRDIGTICVETSTGAIHHFGRVLLDLDGVTIRPGDFDFG